MNTRKISQNASTKNLADVSWAYQRHFRNIWCTPRPEKYLHLWMGHRTLRQTTKNIHLKRNRTEKGTGRNALKRLWISQQRILAQAIRSHEGLWTRSPTWSTCVKIPAYLADSSLNHWLIRDSIFLTIRKWWANFYYWRLPLMRARW